MLAADADERNARLPGGRLSLLAFRSNDTRYGGMTMETAGIFRFTRGYRHGIIYVSRESFHIVLLCLG